MSGTVTVYTDYATFRATVPTWEALNEYPIEGITRVSSTSITVVGFNFSSTNPLFLSNYADTTYHSNGFAQSYVYAAQNITVEPYPATGGGIGFYLGTAHANPGDTIQMSVNGQVVANYTASGTSDTVFVGVGDTVPITNITLTDISDPNDSVDLVGDFLESGLACFLAGTRISTPGGEIAVEDLAIGDNVTTLSGVAKPVKWIGRRSYDGRFVAGNRKVLPIQIRADALRDSVPRRDLYVSPLHAILLDDVLVPAELLVNGVSILHCDNAETVEYFHIELDAHDVIIANGAPAETYADCDNRGAFHNAQEFESLYPSAAPLKRAFCAPLIEDGEKLANIRTKLAQRLAAFDYTTTFEPDLRLMVDGCPLTAASVDNFIYRFELPNSPRQVRIVSRVSVPDDIRGGYGDSRRLGVNLRNIVLRDENSIVVIGHQHISLRKGFHPAEATHRWTDGDAVIPQKFLACFEHGLTVEVHLLNHPLPYVVPLPQDLEERRGEAAQRSSRYQARGRMCCNGGGSGSREQSDQRGTGWP